MAKLIFNHRRFMVSLALLASPVVAADFRVLDLGESCDSVPALEKGQGSVQIPWKHVAGADVYAFKGRDFDRDILITYFCVQGSLFTGNYYFPTEPLDNAVKSYHKAYEHLVSMYGKPFLDNSPWQFSDDKKDPRYIESDPRNYMTSWHTLRLDTVMSLQPDWKSEISKWRVFVVVDQIRK